MTIEEIRRLIIKLVHQARLHEGFGVRLADRPDEELRHGFHTSEKDMMESHKKLLEAIEQYAAQSYAQGMGDAL